MELDDALKQRRSIREYNGEKVDEGQLRELIQAALYAPTWKNTETARYYVAESDKMRAAVNDVLPEGNKKKTVNASAFIVCTFVPNISGCMEEGTLINELGNGWGIYDSGLQNMNLLLKATELGLSTLVMGMRDADKLKEVLGIPKEEVLVSVIAVGHSDQTPDMPARKGVDEIAKFL